MVDVNNAVMARIKKQNLHFEVLVDCDNALAFKGGSDIDIKSVLAVMKVFSDARKGLEASETTMKSIFGTSDPLEVAKEIIKKGEVQITAEHRAKIKETKRRQILNLLHRNGVDPKTNFPHPPQRIEAAMDEAKVKIDEHMDINRQVQEILKELRVILPIKFVMKELAIKIPPEYAAKSYSIVTSFGKKIREEWQRDGSWLVVVEIPGGLEQDFYDKLNALCHGNVESKILSVK